MEASTTQSGPANPSTKQDMRQQAEVIARGRAIQSSEAIEALSPEDMRKTLHELKVHQIELEMQNEELRRTQSDLEAAQARYFDLYNLAPIGYCTLSEKGIILEANLASATILGETRSSLLQKPIYRFILKEDQDIFYLHRKLIFDAGGPQVFELQMLKKNSTTCWVRIETTGTHDNDGSLVCHIALSDITKRKQAEKKLAESETRLDSIIKTVPDIIYRTNCSGNITFISNAIRQYGYEPEELTGTKIIDIVYLPDAKKVSYQMNERRAGDRSLKSFEVRWLTKNRSIVPFEIFSVAAVGLYESDKNILNHIGTQGLARDITEKNRLRPKENC